MKCNLVILLLVTSFVGVSCTQSPERLGEEDQDIGKDKDKPEDPNLNTLQYKDSVLTGLESSTVDFEHVALFLKPKYLDLLKPIVKDQTVLAELTIFVNSLHDIAVTLGGKAKTYATGDLPGYDTKRSELIACVNKALSGLPKEVTTKFDSDAILALDEAKAEVTTRNGQFTTFVGENILEAFANVSKSHEYDAIAAFIEKHFIPEINKLGVTINDFSTDYSNLKSALADILNDLKVKPSTVTSAHKAAYEATITKLTKTVNDGLEGKIKHGDKSTLKTKLIQEYDGIRISVEAAEKAAQDAKGKAAAARYSDGKGGATDMQKLISDALAAALVAETEHSNAKSMGSVVYESKADKAAKNAKKHAVSLAKRVAEHQLALAVTAHQKIVSLSSGTPVVSDLVLELRVAEKAAGEAEAVYNLVSNFSADDAKKASESAREQAKQAKLRVDAYEGTTLQEAEDSVKAMNLKIVSLSTSKNSSSAELKDLIGKAKDIVLNEIKKAEISVNAAKIKGLNIGTLDLAIGSAKKAVKDTYEVAADRALQRAQDALNGATKQKNEAFAAYKTCEKIPEVSNAEKVEKIAVEVKKFYEEAFEFYRAVKGFNATDALEMDAYQQELKVKKSAESARVSADGKDLSSLVYRSGVNADIGSAENYAYLARKIYEDTIVTNKTKAVRDAKAFAAKALILAGDAVIEAQSFGNGKIKHELAHAVALDDAIKKTVTAIEAVLKAIADADKAIMLAKSASAAAIDLSKANDDIRAARTTLFAAFQSFEVNGNAVAVAFENIAGMELVEYRDVDSSVTVADVDNYIKRINTWIVTQKSVISHLEKFVKSIEPFSGSTISILTKVYTSVNKKLTSVKKSLNQVQKRGGLLERAEEIKIDRMVITGWKDFALRVEALDVLRSKADKIGVLSLLFGSYGWIDNLNVLSPTSDFGKVQNHLKTNANFDFSNKTLAKKLYKSDVKSKADVLIDARTELHRLLSIKSYYSSTRLVRQSSTDELVIKEYQLAFGDILLSKPVDKSNCKEILKLPENSRSIFLNELLDSLLVDRNSSAVFVNRADVKQSGKYYAPLFELVETQAEFVAFLKTIGLDR